LPGFSKHQAAAASKPFYAPWDARLPLSPKYIHL
jgi:hypothetical protein